MKKSKRNLFLSIISLVLVSSVLVLTTFEHTQSGFSVLGKNFFSGAKSGDCDVELYWTDNLDTEWKNVETTGNEIPFGSDIRWEPDVPVVRYFKIKNAGSRTIEYDLGIEDPDSDIEAPDYILDHQICNVIDVYYSKIENIDSFNIATLLSGQAFKTLGGCFESGAFFEGHRPTLSGNNSVIYAFAFQMNHNAGNDYQGNGSLGTAGAGFRIYVGANPYESGPDITGLHINLPQNEGYEFLYRVGNANNVPVDKLFKKSENSPQGIGSLFAVTASAESFDKDNLDFTCTPVNDSFNVSVTFNKGSGNTFAEVLSGGTLKFSGTGVIKLIMVYDGDPVLLDTAANDPAEIYLEVVDGKNCTTAGDLPGSGNAVLLDDVSMTTSSYTLPSGKTLYGNGFTVEDGRSNTSGTGGYFNITKGTVDNVIFKGQVYGEAVTSGTGNQYYAPGIRITGDTNIYNSYISECKYAVSIEGGNVVMKNTTVTGGAVGNLYISGGSLTLENCTTATSIDGGLKGLGVHAASASCKIILKGEFKQYNWLTSGELPSSYRSLLNSLYSSEYAYNSRVNMGILFVNESGISLAEAQSAISDSTGNNYGFVEKSLGTVYTAKGTMGSPDMLSYPGYSAAANGQYNTIPNYSFDFTNKNYIAKTDGSNLDCYRDNTTGIVNISFDKENESSHFDWNPKILTLDKYNLSMVDYTITMGDNDYSNSQYISFTESGDYQVVYSYTDSNQYFYSTDTGVHQPTEAPSYTHIVNIKVTAVEPEDNTYYAEFSYAGIELGAKKVIANNNTYVMPDVSAASSTVGSTTVGGKTIYFPIVTVPATTSDGNTAYSSGKAYYFAPVFSAIEITDYNQETGAVAHTYNKKSTEWPHGKGSTAGPDESIFGYAPGAAYSNQPYGRSMKTQYYGFGKNNYGLCYTSEEMEPKDSSGNPATNSASSHLVDFHYVSNDGTTYHYLVRFDFQAFTYVSSTCFTEGTSITMADGTQKPIEDISFKDKILSYNFFTGDNEAKSIALLVNHGKDYYKVLNLKFKDGTLLRLIGDHGVFDYTLNKYVYLTEYNYKDYIGHRFVKLKENGKFKKVKLIDVSVTEEYTTAYSITSAQNSNAFAQDMLTVAPPDEFYNWVDMSGMMRYDKEQFDADVKKYGLYDYSVFKDYVSYDSFIAFNGPYLKVAVEKGKFTFDDIIKLIELYGSYMK